MIIIKCPKCSNVNDNFIHEKCTVTEDMGQLNHNGYYVKYYCEKCNTYFTCYIEPYHSLEQNNDEVLECTNQVMLHLLGIK